MIIIREIIVEKESERVERMRFLNSIIRSKEKVGEKQKNYIALSNNAAYSTIEVFKDFVKREALVNS